MNPLIQLKKAAPVFLVALLLACFTIPQSAQAVVPAPDGGYPGGNTAEGQAALLSLTTGGFNTAVGFLSLRSDTVGQLNTAIGAGTLLANTADNNTATGAGALLSNSTGARNTANGTFALFSNTTGSFNTATGTAALSSNDTGSSNTANGFQALAFATTGDSNTAIGFQALFNNTTGIQNTANGFQALVNNTNGSFNTAIGMLALPNNTTGGNDIALGVSAGANVTTANGVICIGAAGANVDNGCYIGQIFGATVPGGGATVIVDSNGHLGTVVSSQRFKDQIKSMDKASEALFSLKPVTFRYKKEIDPTGISQFGLVAEDVDKVNPDLVVRDKEGKPYSVRYDQVNAMLLNEFLKAHRQIDAQQKQIEALTAGLQKVSAQLEASKTAPQVVKNP